MLLVDDDDLVREHVRAMLEDLGYGVHAVPSAPEALDALAGAGPFALLLTDVTLPGGMTGIELVREARKTCPALPVIIISGYAGETGAVFGADVPAAHALHKPLRRGDLAAKLRAAPG